MAQYVPRSTFDPLVDWFRVGCNLAEVFCFFPFALFGVTKSIRFVVNKSFRVWI